MSGLAGVTQPGHLRHERRAGQNSIPHDRHRRDEIVNDRSRITWHRGHVVWRALRVANST